MRLSKSFFARPTLEVANEVVGTTMVYKQNGLIQRIRIVEVEAYIGEDDPACHAAAGFTARTAVMYGESGHAYVYFIYGMYYCLNVVTEKKGYPAAILIRAAEVVSGFDQPTVSTLSGPGKICRDMCISRMHTGKSVCSRHWYFEEGTAKASVACSQRIGISKGKEHLWRFFDPQSRSLSGSRTLNCSARKTVNNDVIPGLDRAR